MEGLEERIKNALMELFEKHFECPDRNWPAETHRAIAAIKGEVVARVEAEFERLKSIGAAAVSSAHQTEERK